MIEPAHGSSATALLSRIRSKHASLLTHLLVGLAIFVAIFVIWWLFGVHLALFPWAVLTLLVSSLVWLLRTGPDPAESVTWVDHQAIIGEARSDTDLATRRLADMISGAQPGRDFSSHQLARVLRDLAAQRLVRDHHADLDQPLTSGNKALSPQLLKYLNTVETGDSPSVSRRTLHRHLKEIQSL